MKKVVEDHWSEQEERGSYLALRFMLFLYRMGGKWVCDVVVYFVVFYFFLTGRCARKASLQYLRRVYDFDVEHGGFSKRPGLWQVFCHFLSFGRSSLDKLDAWAGHVGYRNLRWHNRALLFESVKQKKGGVLIGAHVGCMEVLRKVASHDATLKFNALVFTEHAQRVNQMLRVANPDIEVNLISVKEFTPDVAILLADKVERGEFVVIMGDRSPVGARGRVVQVPFLGYEAPWSTGPMLLAHLIKCPIFFIVCLRTGSRHYDVHLELFESEKLALPRKGREAALRGAVEKYAAMLEGYCCLAPYQWFNFYDFWSERSE